VLGLVFFTPNEETAWGNVSETTYSVSSGIYVRGPNFELEVDWKSILPTKLVAAATSLEGSKNLTSDHSTAAIVLPSVQQGEFKDRTQSLKRRRKNEHFCKPTFGCKIGSSALKGCGGNCRPDGK